MSTSNSVIEAKHIVVVGAGAIGSHGLELLARMLEVGKITIVDRDTYDAANVSSQRVTRRDAKRKKAEVWPSRLKQIRPSLRVVAVSLDFRDVPVGYLRSDLILSCVDSRVARQLINQRARRLGLPWIDSGVDGGSLLVRVNPYGAGPDAPCLECPWSDADYAALEVEYSCQKRGESMPTGTSAALGALAASLQALEAQKYLRSPERVLWNQQLVHDAGSQRIRLSRMTRNPHCRFDHESWPQVREIACAAGELTLGQAFLMDRDASTPALALTVENGPFARQVNCPGCGDVQRFAPLPRLQSSLAGGRCVDCGAPWLTPGSELMERIEWSSLSDEQRACSLADLGLRAGDIYTIADGHNSRTYLVPMNCFTERLSA